MPESTKLKNEMSEVLAELLEYGGIICKKEETPKLYRWEPEVEGRTKRIEITTFAKFMETLDSGKYQFETQNPSIEGIDPEPFLVETFIVEVDCVKSGNEVKFSSSRVHTDTEEIMPSYAKDTGFDEQKVKARSQKMGKKIEGALTLLSILYKACQVIKELSEAREDSS